jgi:hypothetical protein
MPKYLDNFKRFVSSIGDLGRYGDTYIVHASKGETVVPTEVLDKNPVLRKQLFNTMRDMGIEPERYVVGNELNSINPVTGQAEFFGHKKFFRKVIPKEIRDPISSFTEGVEDAFDDAGEFLEEEILDPAGEFLGEEIAQPLRRQVSKAMPDELDFLGNILGAAGGGKLAAFLASPLLISNPLLYALIVGGGAAAGDVAGDYLSTEVDEEFDPNVLSAALSGITAGIGSLPGPKEIGQTGIRAGDTVTQQQLADAGLGETLSGDYFIKDAAGKTAQELADANAIMSALGGADPNLAIQLAGGEGLTLAQAAGNIGRDFVAAAQPFVDPLELYGPESGTLMDAFRVGGTGGEIAKNVAIASGKALAVPTAEVGIDFGLDYYEAMQQAENDYREYLRQRGLRADQVRDQSRTLRRQYYIQSFKNRGYSDAEIAEVLLRARLIDSLEDYDPNDLPQDRKFGEDVTDDTIYAARGGRVGFDNGGMGGIGQFVEEQKIREEFMDKMKRGLGAMEMNMKLNDPGMFGRIRNVLNPMDNEPFFYTREEMRFPDTKKRYESMIRGMDEDRAAADFEMKDKMDLVEDYMNRLDAMGTTGGMSRQKNAMGTRTTPEGDPISPDMPNGMQMDLRGGGFIPLGTKPKADDVPAMVGKNEFVLNDEAVSGIGKMMTGRPDPRAGARALYKLQNEMEAIV